MWVLSLLCLSPLYLHSFKHIISHMSHKFVWNKPQLYTTLDPFLLGPPDLTRCTLITRMTTTMSIFKPNNPKNRALSMTQTELETNQKQKFNNRIYVVRPSLCLDGNHLGKTRRNLVVFFWTTTRWWDLRWVYEYNQNAISYTQSNQLITFHCSHLFRLDVDDYQSR